MKIFFTLLLINSILQVTTQTALAQSHSIPVWTDSDKKYLLDNLIRSREEIMKETKSLTKAQWAFKESPERWNINQIVEHIAIWELLFMREISQALSQSPDSIFMNFAADSIFLNNDSKGINPKSALEYTKPFSFAVPLGNNEGINNVIWLNTMRNESIDYLKNEMRNIRLHYIGRSGRNIHHNYMIIFAHTDRHLKQIRKLKAHPMYPK